MAGPTNIVYSARYYWPGDRPSHYKIYLVDAEGPGRRQLTFDEDDDGSPVWLDDDTILFLRQDGKGSRLCQVNVGGGTVTDLAELSKGAAGITGLAPDHRSLFYGVSEPWWRLYLLDIATRKTRPLGRASDVAWSPDSRRLYLVTWDQDGRRRTAEIQDLASGNRISLSGELGAAAWLEDGRLVVDVVEPEGRPHLVVLDGGGTVKREIALPFIWKGDDLSPFADALFAVPGNTSAILYGQHAGNSTQGAAQRFYRVPLNGDEATVVADGNDLAWSPDHRSFLTGAGRDLAQLDRQRTVWVSPLSVVRFPDGQRRTIVEGLVSVGGFDWRCSPTSIPAQR